MTRLHIFAVVGWLALGCGDGATPASDAPSVRDGAGADALASIDATVDATVVDAAPDAVVAYACCTVDGLTCTDTETEALCTGGGGYSWWSGQTCAEHTCTNEVQGACCNEGECQDAVTVDLCEGLGGTHGGAGSTCADIVCP